MKCCVRKDERMASSSGWVVVVKEGMPERRVLVLALRRWEVVKVRVGGLERWLKTNAAAGAEGGHCWGRSAGVYVCRVEA